MIPTSDSKHGLSTFLSFGAKSVQPAILEKMLVGRLQTADLLEQYARQIADNGVNNQVFIIGPRGSGKTHLLRVLYHRITDLVQKKRVIVAYFAEEEYGISGYLDFLIRIINAFMRWYDNDKSALEAQLNILRETPESRQEYVAEKLISDYVGEKPLLILSENFDSILDALGRNGQGKLRAWLYRHNRISIIATAQATTPDLGREDRPFYGFFSTIKLKKLSYEDSLTLLTTLAETEKNENMLAHLAGKGRGQVRAIHELVKGNHRLLVTFYEFLKADTLADLSVVFMKTMNDLKPYYETFIRFLPAQQQKILHYLALAKIPRQGTDIAKDCFISTTSLSKQLSELQRQNLIDALPDPTDKRNKLYDVSEPLFRIAIEIGEQREGIAALFVNFMALWYSYDEIKSQKQRFEGFYDSETEPLIRGKLLWEMDARERALDLKKESGYRYSGDLLQLMMNQLESNNYDALLSLAKTAASSERDTNFHLILGYAHLTHDYFEEAIDELLASLKLSPNNYEALKNLGIVYAKNKQYDKAIEAYHTVLSTNPSDYETWYNLGTALSDNDEIHEAIRAYEQALLLHSTFPQAWFNVGKSYSDLQEFEQAINAYHEVLKLEPTKRDAWYNLGIAYSSVDQLDLAVSAYQKALSFETPVRVPEHQIWNNIGVIYNKQGKFDDAIEAYKNAINLNSSDYWAWNNIGVIYLRTDSFLDAVECIENAIQLNSQEHSIWHNLGIAHYGLGDYNEAIKNYMAAFDVNPNYAGEMVFIEGSIINYLRTQKASKLDLSEYEVWLQNHPGFEVVATYVNIYRRVVFDKEEKALYELPKEQRIFFEREILKRNVE